MVDFFKLVETPGVAAIISFMLGLGLASMLRPVCKGPECLVVRGPPVQDIRNAVYQFGTKCVEFQPKAVECPKDKEASVGVVDTMSFADYSA
jgi:hypothetical protein